MSEKQKYQAYAAATQTVAKTKQIIMLYDGVIRFLQQAKDAIRNKRIEERFNSLTKAGEIVRGLQGCLDFENGGNVARILYSFYSNIDGKIFSVHRTNSVETCDEVIDELKRMRDVWAEIDQQSSSGAPEVLSPASVATPSASTEQTVILSA